jgi:hypothetical protein
MALIALRRFVFFALHKSYRLEHAFFLHTDFAIRTNF